MPSSWDDDQGRRSCQVAPMPGRPSTAAMQFNSSFEGLSFPQFHVAVLGADCLSDHTLRYGLEVLVQHGLQLEELRPKCRVEVRLDDSDHYCRATLTGVPIRS